MEDLDQLKFLDGKLVNKTLVVGFANFTLEDRSTVT